MSLWYLLAGNDDFFAVIMLKAIKVYLVIQRHLSLSPECDHGIEVSSASLKPSIGEEALVRPAAVDLYTLGLCPRPQSVCVTRPGYGRANRVKALVSTF